MIKVRFLVTLVISSASLIRRCYLGVLEDLPEGVTVELVPSFTDSPTTQWPVPTVVLISLVLHTRGL